MEKLKVSNLSVKFNEKYIVKDINLYINEGELVSLIGISGSGKSTIFNAITSLIEINSGEILLNGENIVKKTGKISYMLQKDLLLPFKTIIDNVSLPLIIKGENKKLARDKASKYFEQFGLKGTENQYPKSLSGGMRQRAALLRTYMFSKDVALLDEPFSALDAITKKKMHQWYLEIMKSIKMSTLLITHDIDEAILLSNRIYILGGTPGKIINEIKIDLDKTIPTNELELSKEFLNYKRKILELL